MTYWSNECHDLLIISVTWLVDMCDMTHSCVWHDTCAWWCIHVCDMTHSYVCQDSFTCCAGSRWCIHMSHWTSHVTPMSHVTPIDESCHTHGRRWAADSPLGNVTRLIHMCDMTRPFVWHDVVMCAIYLTWLLHVCDMAYAYVCHDSFIFVKWRVHTCDMTPWCVRVTWQNAFICVTWLIHICAMTHSYVPRGPHLCGRTHSCVTWLVVGDERLKKKRGWWHIRAQSGSASGWGRTGADSGFYFFLYILLCLQHSATQVQSCHTLQHTATHCNTRHRTATHYDTLLHMATPCKTLQHSATQLNTPLHAPGHVSILLFLFVHITLRHIATHCNTLQHTATHGNTLQHTATHCNTLQHTATHNWIPRHASGQVRFWLSFLFCEIFRLRVLFSHAF